MVPQFLDRMKHINMLLAQFPGATAQDCFSSEEIKTIFYHAMPVRWRTNFINSGQSLSTASIKALRTYMEQHEQQTGAHRKKVRDINKKNSKHQRGTKNHSFGSSSSHQSRNKRTFGSGSKGDKKEKKKKRLSNEDDCHIHGGTHTWGQCH